MARPLSETLPTAFVTGAGAGLGRAFALMLLADGVRVWGTSRDPARLAADPGLAAGGLTAVGLDLHDGPGASAAFARAQQEAGGCFDVVVANAGYGVYGGFTAVESRVWESQVAAMLGTVMALSHQALAAMQARGRGTLVHVSSLAAEFPLPFMSGYNVAKAGLSALSESLIFETRGTAIRVLDFRPGDHRTGFNTGMLRPGPGSSREDRAWAVLDRNLEAGPAPAAAAADLRRALARGRRGVVRSGGFFQARVAPLGGRLLPRGLMRALEALYFGSP